MGNLASLTLGAARTATFAYVGTTPKLSSVTESGGIGTRNVTYDGAGNETAVGLGGFTYSSRNYLATGEGFTYAYDGNGLRCMATNATSRRYSFYSPEMNLLSETYLTTATPPLIQHEYIWFAGQPVAQIDDGAPDVTTWDFTDHLGTPFIQTDSAANLLWRAEYEPYGRVFALRTPNRYQPLRLPGQEAEELNVLSTDGNGATERSNNVFRWYRNRWGRYSQADPLARVDRSLESWVLYSYVLSNPVTFVDPLGLQARSPACPGCPPVVRTTYKRICVLFGRPWTNAANSIDARTQKCIQRKCYAEPIVTIDCNWPYCQFPSVGGQTWAPWEISICPTNVGGPDQSPCLQRLIVHEMLHTCNLGGPGNPPTPEPVIRKMGQLFPCQ